MIRGILFIPPMQEVLDNICCGLATILYEQDGIGTVILTRPPQSFHLLVVELKNEAKWGDFV